MAQPLQQAIVIQKRGHKTALRAKLNAKCRDCIYDPHSEGTWRKQVEKCTSFICPLYEVRPTSKKGANR